MGDRPGARRAARRPPASRPRGVARPGPGPLRLAGPLPAAAPPAGGDLPGVGLAAPVVARARLRLPRRAREGARRPPRSRRRSRWGRPSPRSSCGCAPRATRSSTPRSPRWSRPPTARRSRGSRRRRGATRRTATSPTCSGAARRRAGRYEEAAELYRQLLAADPADAVARNNLANIEFVRGSYDAARARYRAGTEAGAERRDRGHLVLQPVARPPPEVRVPGLQRGQVERGPARPRAGGRLRPVEVRLARLRGGGPRPDAASRSGTSSPGASRGSRCGTSPRGRGRRRGRGPLAGSLANRFVASVGVFALAAFLVGRWRGPKAFTLHCGRCGTAFCRYCHLGQVSGGLCSQCYHLFVVRDGVSGPARNRKMAEVQRADGRRERVFRVLSVLSPGAGQVYGGWTFRGAALLAGLVRGAGAARGPTGGALHGSAEAPVAAVAGGGGRAACSSASGWPRTGSAPSPTSSCRPARPARGGPGPRRRRDRRWPSKGRSATSDCRTSSSSSGCSGRPAS